jgi:hypothetical protein
MNDNQPFMQRLRRLIGRDCRFYGRSCRIVDILIDDGRFVLETRDSTPPIQTDQYGQATCRANDHIDVSLFDQAGDMSEDLMHLLDGLAPDIRSEIRAEANPKASPARNGANLSGLP